MSDWTAGYLYNHVVGQHFTLALVVSICVRGVTIGYLSNFL